MLTVLAMFERMEDAKAAHDELEREHLGNVDIVSPNDRPRKLETYGIPSDAEPTYLEAIREGLIMVVTQLSSDRTSDARQVLRRHHPVDMSRREARGSTGIGRAGDGEVRRAGERDVTRPGPVGAGRRERTDVRGERGGRTERVPVVEEELRVGKREVEEGGVRVTSHVTERPVEEHVELRDERVNVERRPVDRPASDRDFRDRSIEARERHEEAVVDKRARVVEEVIVTREAGTHTEDIRDTIRRTDVEIERLGLDEDYRAHHGRSFRGRGDYESVKPAYRFGAHMASQPEYRGRDWSMVEGDARRRFEERNPGRWEELKDAVRHGYERMRSKTR